nr:MAG TPA: hypothetical protein [Bacteriophage sp.]
MELFIYRMIILYRKLHYLVLKLFILIIALSLKRLHLHKQVNIL